MTAKHLDTLKWVGTWNAMSRRRFLSLSGGLIATTLVASCMRDEPTPEVDQVTLDAGQVPQSGGEPLHSEEGSFYLINYDEGLLALYTRCTHQGCEIKWNGGEQTFDCPCHLRT